MNTKSTFFIVFFSFFATTVYAQEKPDFYSQVKPGSFANGVSERRFSDSNSSRLVMNFENGFEATNLEDLIHSADIVVLGSYGTYLGNSLFYGYADPVTGAGIGRIGIPLSEYEVIVEDVMKGAHLLPEKLVVRISEMPDAHTRPEIARHREGRHLFFFALNPDGLTVGLHGPMFDLKETNEAFVMTSEGREVPVLGSDMKDKFLSEVLSLTRQP